MNWDTIGAIGEILGAIAVVITILYLARQTKGSARSVDVTSAREISFRVSEWFREAARDPELKRILTKSIQPELQEYADGEWYEFHLLAASLMELYQAHYMHASFKVGQQGGYRTVHESRTWHYPTSCMAKMVGSSSISKGVHLRIYRGYRKQRRFKRFAGVNWGVRGFCLMENEGSS